MATDRRRVRRALRARHRRRPQRTRPRRSGVHARRRSCCSMPATSRPRRSSTASHRCSSPGVAAAQGSATVMPRRLARGARLRPPRARLRAQPCSTRGSALAACAVFTGSGALVRRRLLADAAPLSRVAGDGRGRGDRRAVRQPLEGRPPRASQSSRSAPAGAPHEWELETASRATAARHLVLGPPRRAPAQPPHAAPPTRTARVVGPSAQRRASGMLLAWSSSCLIAGSVPYRVVAARPR